MSSVTSTQNGQPQIDKWEALKQNWAKVAPYAVPPMAAGVAIVPAFRFYMQKSDAQLEKPIARVTVAEGCKEGVKAAPNVARLVGIQMVAQGVVERTYQKVFGNPAQPKETVGSKAASTTVVAAASVYPVAIFNGHAIKMTAKESIKALTSAQAAAIFTQELCFVGGVASSKPVSKKAQEVFGNHWTVKYGSAFFAGAAGTGAGHAANTCFTRWQKGKTMLWQTMPRAEMFTCKAMKQIAKEAFLGFARRTPGGGLFTVGYTIVTDVMTPTTPKK